MKRYRSILALILAMVTTLLVSCGSPTATRPTTYTAEKIEQIQQYAVKVVDLREEMPALETSIQNRNWTDVGTFIHGPLGDLRRRMSYVTRELFPQDQKVARATAKDLFEYLEKIDIASEERNYELAIQNYRGALKDFDDFLKLIPEASESAASL